MATTDETWAPPFDDPDDPEPSLDSEPSLDDEPTLPPQAELTDLGMAQRLVARHGPVLRYCHPWGTWLVYDGRRWRQDDTSEATRCAIDTVKAMAADALEIADDKERRETLKHALKSEGEARIRAMLSLAQSLEPMPVLPDELDADPWLLNLHNGTLNLRTLELRAHDPADLLTKLAPVAYDPAAEAPRWSAFIEKIFAGDLERIRYVQKLAGYSLTGTTGAQLLPVCHGLGANGKSTLLETLLGLLGDYAHQAPSELLLHSVRGRGGATPDLADLQGRRLVCAVETGEGRRLDEPLVKRLTGGDTINARRLYGQPFTFRPTHKLWLATNHMPEVRGAGEAIWRRLAMIPFDVTIPPAEQIDQARLIGQHLAEGAGILNWALQGLLGWQTDGLDPPGSVQAATAAYRADMDIVGTFLAECCVTVPNAEVKGSVLYDTYCYWAGEHDRISSADFGRRLRDRGIPKKHRRDGTWHLGVGLRHEDTQL